MTTNDAVQRSNGFKRLEFERCPPPRLCSYRQLLPSDATSDTWVINDICEDFRVHGQTHDARMLDLRCSIGDFAFVRKRDGEQIAVEVKREVASVNSVGEIHCLAQLPREDKPSDRACYFSAIRPVDVYLIRLQSSPESWLLMLRDHLPQDWFDLSTAHWSADATLTLKWLPEDPEFLSKHLISCGVGDSARFVSRVEEVLDQYTSLRTRRERPFLSPHTFAGQARSRPLGTSSRPIEIDSSSSTTSENDNNAQGATRPVSRDETDEESAESRVSKNLGPDPTAWSQAVFEAMEVGRFNRQCEEL